LRVVSARRDVDAHLVLRFADGKFVVKVY